MFNISDSISKTLNAPYFLTPDQIEFYKKYKFIKLKDVLDIETLEYFNRVISLQVNEMNREQTVLEERSTYGKAFLQLFNLWRENALIK